MPLDTSKNNQKIPVNPGEVLFIGGKASTSMNILHEGSVRVETTLGDTSIVLYSLEGANLTPGIFALLEGTPYPYTIRAKTSCVISTYVMNQPNAKKTLTSKVSVGVMAVRTLLKEIGELYKRVISIKGLSAKFEQTMDNLGAVYYILNPSIFSDVSPGALITRDENIIDPVMKLIRNNLAGFQEHGGILPDKPSVTFLEEDHGEFFERNYSEAVEWNDAEFHFIRKILSVNPKISQALFEADPTLLQSAAESYVKTYRELFEILNKETFELSEMLNTMFAGENSLIEKFNLTLDLFNTGYSTIPSTVLLPVTEWALKKSKSLLEEYKQIFGSPFASVGNSLDKLETKQAELTGKYSHELSAQKNKEELSAQGNGTIHAGIDTKALKVELLNSASQILNYSQVDPDSVKEFSTLMVKLKSFKNPLDPEPDNRKIRRTIAKTYWDVYKKSFSKWLQAGKQAPKAVELMLRYGYFDETLLDEGHIVELVGRLHQGGGNPSAPIHYGTDWLERIYSREAPTSVDELGQTFFEKLKMDLKDSGIKSEKDIPPDYDTGEARLGSEITSMYEPNVRLTSGNIASHFPILTRYHITIPLDKCFVSKEDVEKALQYILGVDYTAFNREVIYRNEDIGIKNEFIQRSIIPDFILVPSIGPKIMMWQDLSIFRGAGSKESRGRICIPHFVTGDLKTFMLEAIAAFRWELCKNILGPDWNNVGIPSITADYTDYVQFYKKSKDLSPELKEKISSEFKRFRTDRDKFAYDYSMWIRYEAEGVQRVNRVVRSIFYRHIPFHKNIREKVSSQPAYSELHNRFKNIRTRQHKEFENKYKKYMDASGNLPKELYENLTFYEV
ncbi:cyclic nucleotide-binding domain-containing protein [Leptospira kanakyensis]|uniref:Crp/Fnr family transcriptional regulator n=1 Tax=Leptospira kanakyensis TaxID=2484968 RepID=A0A6N4QLK1_9LEPT|nr:cyclic nucleotide-binding domain-containing protein [Leptospira kanakyensis]MCW7468271.1 cyclic nucleotide-binding domain-containing protein [Leptospira kanakyensis]TGK55350.1 Crp/Fnr family transcriptional regulator [Leptospira kanakyensis]TGK60884.1 Crp/Fnr family transcriptional regulator [Leptospira kanakyensis]TGK76641.1 Crp/Fnr family transcriptional regulator [Leptospira kanakyensis]